MTVQEAITRKALERETVSKELILKYLASKKMPVDYNDFINNRLFKCSTLRYWWFFYDKNENIRTNIRNGRRVVGVGDEKQSTGIFDINGILLFDDDIVYHKQTNLFYIVKKEEGNIYLCRKQYVTKWHSFEYSLKDLIVSQDLKFVAAHNDEIKFCDRYISFCDTIKTIY
jgi:hypothetical protein